MQYVFFFPKWPSIVLQSLVSFSHSFKRDCILYWRFFLLICEKCELTNLYYISIFFLIRVYFSSGIHCVESNMSFLQGFSWLKLNIRTIKPIPKTQPAIASMKPGSVQNLQLVIIRKKVWIIYHPIYWISLSLLNYSAGLKKVFTHCMDSFYVVKKLVAKAKLVEFA